MVIGDQILGRHNPWSDLYSTTRVKTLLEPSSLPVGTTYRAQQTAVCEQSVCGSCITSACK